MVKLLGICLCMLWWPTLSALLHQTQVLQISNHLKATQPSGVQVCESAYMWKAIPQYVILCPQCVALCFCTDTICVPMSVIVCDSVPKHVALIARLSRFADMSDDVAATGLGVRAGE